MKFAYFFFALPLPKTRLIENLRLQLHSMKEGTDIMLGKPNQVALPWLIGATLQNQQINGKR